jgi:hypothetical protein
MIYFDAIMTLDGVGSNAFFMQTFAQTFSTPKFATSEKAHGRTKYLHRYLVPTRALISQVVIGLREKLARFDLPHPRCRRYTSK